MTKRDGGFTWVELLAAMALFSTLVLITGVDSVRVFQSNGMVNRYMDDVLGARQAVRTLEHDAREAETVVVVGAPGEVQELQLTIEHAAVVYRVCRPGDTPTLCRHVDGKPEQPLAANVGGFTLRRTENLMEIELELARRAGPVGRRPRVASAVVLRNVRGGSK